MSRNRQRLIASAWFVVIVCAVLLSSCRTSPADSPAVPEGIVATGVTLELPAASVPIRASAANLTVDPSTGRTSLRGHVKVAMEGSSAFRVTADQLEVDRNGSHLRLTGRVHATMEIGVLP